MNIVTGYTGSPHVTSNAAQGFNQGIFGAGNYVLNVGNKFEAELTDANTVTIADGEGVLQGVHFRIDPGTTETVNIANGTTGYKRVDYICARYAKNALTGVESVTLVVVEGTPDASTPTAPTINTGDVLTGSSPVDFPLYEVDLDGLTPTLVPFTSNPSNIVIPPYFDSISKIWKKYGSFTEDTVIENTGWYAVWVDKSTQSASQYVKCNVYVKTPNPVDQSAWTIIAGVNDFTATAISSMTPWLFLRSGQEVRFKCDAETAILLYSPMGV